MITIEQGESSPYILIDTIESKMIMRGNSFVSDPNTFYQVVTNWGRTFKLGPDKKLAVEITMGYFSTSNLQVFNLFFKILNNNNRGQIDITFLIDREEEEDLEEAMLSLVFNTAINYKMQYI